MKPNKSTDEHCMSEQQSSILAQFGSIAKPISKASTQIHVKALDAVVSVNSFFTVAVFLGLSFDVPQKSATPVSACVPGANVVKYLLVFEVVSFGCFLFSSLIAQGMKLRLIFYNSSDPQEAQAVEINQKILRFGMIASAMGSTAGTLFLLLSMINIIQLELGSWSCGKFWPQRAAIPLIVLVGNGGIIFISSVFYAALH
ncbi:hypothetical protein O6H91_13G101500 [Diphasiastrum complanatum]|uniref:Uncharacterized protein n=1 Tax=Diphasiastrum complanatum TaxID=34168 RepID=A0ACC2BY81_DIPCM|nr:hypothetical protein O6H91_13G101500 [Diphasiastrum complanatum]